MRKTGTIRTLGLGKGSIGEAVCEGPTFKRVASLLIPADFIETQTAASRRRMWHTRQAQTIAGDFSGE